mmetsp:Transcript_113752/g.367529  ORF Transcript_113752/g.367529 Transcript_113752/m.367529 type:complete len:210 (+) Transcript_113752:265-894(+)
MDSGASRRASGAAARLSGETCAGAMTSRVVRSAAGPAMHSPGWPGRADHGVRKEGRAAKQPCTNEAAPAWPTPPGASGGHTGACPEGRGATRCTCACCGLSPTVWRCATGRCLVASGLLASAKFEECPDAAALRGDGAAVVDAEGQLGRARGATGTPAGGAVTGGLTSRTPTGRAGAQGKAAPSPARGGWAAAGGWPVAAGNAATGNPA